LAKSAAVAAPTPDPAPVTIATWPERSMSTHFEKIVSKRVTGDNRYYWYDR
jgi:hypothetical protein